jgi:hypothetical protein
MWRGTQLVAEDLGSLQPSGNGSYQGAALAVNSFGNIGGWSEQTVGTGRPIRGFLIDKNRISIVSSTDVRSPLTFGRADDDKYKNSVIYGVDGTANACGVSFDSLLPTGSKTNAIVWRGSTAPTQLATPNQSAGNLVHSDSLIFTLPQYSGGLMRPVGRVWTNSIANAVAVLWNSDAISPALLSDSHFSLGSTNWVFTRPRGSNPAGWIVGEGKLNGVPRGFVMIRRN